MHWQVNTQLVLVLLLFFLLFMLLSFLLPLLLLLLLRVFVVKLSEVAPNSLMSFMRVLSTEAELWPSRKVPASAQTKDKTQSVECLSGS